MSFQYWWTVEAFKREYGKIVEWKRGVSPYSAKHEECFVKIVLADDYDALRARVAELEKAIRQMLDVDSEMGVYPAAVSGYNDERDYTQRDGFKNGWNAAVMFYAEAMNKIAVDALAQQEGEG